MTEQVNSPIIPEEVTGNTIEESEKRPAIIKKAAPKKPKLRPGAGLPETVFIGGYRYLPVLEDEEMPELPAAEQPQEPAASLQVEPAEAAGSGFDDFSFAAAVAEAQAAATETPETQEPEEELPESITRAYEEIRRERMQNLDGFELPEVEDQLAFEDLPEPESEPQPVIEQLPEEQEPDLIIDELQPEEAPQQQQEPLQQEQPQYLSIHNVKQPSRGRMIASLVAVVIIFIIMTGIVSVTLDFGGRTVYQMVSDSLGLERVEALDQVAEKVREFKLAISDQEPAPAEDPAAEQDPAADAGDPEALTDPEAEQDPVPAEPLPGEQPDDNSGDVTTGDAASYKVNFYYDGQKVSVDTDGTLTTAELLAAADIRANDKDLLTTPMDAVPVNGSTVQLIRVTESERQAKRVLPYRTLVSSSPLITKGRLETVEEGVPGEAMVTYIDTYRDGVLHSSEMAAVTVVEEPRDRLQIKGDDTAAVSRVSHLSDVKLVDGVPEAYIRKIDDATCTAYNYPDGCYGASGMYLKQGFVAVDPSVIPYGSLLYIVGDDGFTYGWAVAADTGTAIFDGIIDIDCFFETYDESCLFGKKWLDVYVVKQLTQSELQDYMAHEGMFRLRVPA